MIAQVCVRIWGLQMLVLRKILCIYLMRSHCEKERLEHASVTPRKNYPLQSSIHIFTSQCLGFDFKEKQKRAGCSGEMYICFCRKSK